MPANDEVDPILVMVVFFFNAMPFPAALIAVCFLVQNGRIYEFFANPFIIVLSFAIMITSFWLLLKYSWARKLNVYAIGLVQAAIYSETIFIAGICSYSTLLKLITLALACSTGAHFLASIYTLIRGTPDRLKRHLVVTCSFFFIVNLYGAYLLATVVDDNGHEWSPFFQFVFIGMAFLVYSQFAVYFPGALIWYILPELQRQRDVILAWIELWVRVFELCPKVFKRIAFKR